MLAREHREYAGTFAEKAFVNVIPPSRLNRPSAAMAGQTRPRCREW